MYRYVPSSLSYAIKIFHDRSSYKGIAKVLTSPDRSSAVHEQHTAMLKIVHSVFCSEQNQSSLLNADKIVLLLLLVM